MDKKLTAEELVAGCGPKMDCHDFMQAVNEVGLRALVLPGEGGMFCNGFIAGLTFMLDFDMGDMDGSSPLKYMLNGLRGTKALDALDSIGELRKAI